MKNLKMKFSLVVATLFLITAISSCNKDDDTPNTQPTTNNPNDVIGIVNNGSWRITYYYDSDHEETNSFNGYNFTFATGNVLTASNGTNSYTGSWSVTD